MPDFAPRFRMQAESFRSGPEWVEFKMARWKYFDAIEVIKCKFGMQKTMILTGMMRRKNGSDIRFDAVHRSMPSGAEVEAVELIQFLKRECASNHIRLETKK